MMEAIKLNATVPYATRSELEFLSSLEVENVIMLGAGPGVMLLAVLETNKDVPAYVVDIDEQALMYTRLHLSVIGADINVAAIHTNSAEAAVMFPDGSVDLLIVDADHSYESVKTDIQAWWPKVKELGYVFFHDYDADGTEFAGKERYPGVRQAVDEFFADRIHRVVTQVGTAIVIAKDAN